MSRFEMLVGRVGVREGALSMDPNDPGNWTSGTRGLGTLKGTKFGISAHAYPHLDIASLTWDQAKQIYRADYWDRLQCDQLGAPLDDFVFDLGVNSGAKCAAQVLQAAVGTLQDGLVGPKTLSAVKQRPVREVLRLMFVERAMIFALSRHDHLYGRGWFSRLFDVTALALKEL